MLISYGCGKGISVIFSFRKEDIADERRQVINEKVVGLDIRQNLKSRPVF
jgi:hypothetical protein